MKVFFLYSDVKVQNDVIECLDQKRLKINVRKSQNIQDLYDEVDSLDTYNLFILYLENPIDARTMNFIRENGGLAPILLILNHDQDPSTFKTIYYLSYNDIIIKDFLIEEMVYRIYKLCNIWNNDVFFLPNGMYFDCKNAIFINKEEQILLGKKEASLLKYLFLKTPHVATWSEIVTYVYQNEIISQERIRSLVTQLRSKLPIKLIKTVKGQGYQIFNLENKK
ncbi:helix-turn-helix domain-containing protein [Sulfurospirillum arcachonense]|uniref:helix-turn-helix domain-containing protein n=1 Tax=Sulfurospirillum arcachonense TaxID=57666 RepID=UPI000469A8E3|nr:helix-turn-helix domain-containing protein [Sulfurospirillum arcachonense]